MKDDITFECFTEVKAPFASLKKHMWERCALIHRDLTLYTIPIASSLRLPGTRPYAYRRYGIGRLVNFAFPYALAKGSTPQTGLLLLHFRLPLFLSIGHIGEQLHVAGAMPVWATMERGPFSRT